VEWDLAAVALREERSQLVVDIAFVYLIGPSTQIGAKVTHSPPQAFAQEHP
jgi:hypothetical protein